MKANENVERRKAIASIRTKPQRADQILKLHPTWAFTDNRKSDARRFSDYKRGGSDEELKALRGDEPAQ
jgi:hypothetical protein